MTFQISELLRPPESEARAIILQSLGPQAAPPTPISTLTCILRPVDMYGVTISTSSWRAGKKGFRQEGAPNGHLAKIPRLWATTELSVGESGVLDWSGMVSSGGASSSQPRKILHSFQYTLLGRLSARETRAGTRARHTPASAAAR